MSNVRTLEPMNMMNHEFPLKYMYYIGMILHYTEICQI